MDTPPTLIPLLSFPLLSLEEVGATVRRLRKEQGLRQDELAGVANVGLRFIVDLEAGKATIQMGKALKVLEVLGCVLSFSMRSDLYRALMGTKQASGSED
jgi:y4mF family transcriptional regulator